MPTIDPSIYSALGKISPHQSKDAMSELFQELKSTVPIKLATLWKTDGFSRVAYPILRLGYEPDKNSLSEFMHPLEDSFIGKVLDTIIQASVSYWSTEDVTKCEFFSFHQSQRRAINLGLKRLYCIPFKNFHSHSKSRAYAGILNLYVQEDFELDEAFLKFISSRLSDIHSTEFIILKDKISDAMLDIFSVGVTKENASHILERVLREICGPLLRAEAATIYEWDAHRFCYVPVASTGLKHPDAAEPTRHGLIGYVAANVKPLLISNILDPDQVRIETNELFEASVLNENLESTASVPRGCLIVPVLNPAHNDRGKPVAVLKLINKQPFLGANAVPFDYDDIILSDEVGRILALYEEQVRLGQSREAFALLFGHEAQAPASGIRGTADRLLMRIKRDQIDTAQTTSLVQDIFDFSELIVSFAESLTFGFAGRGDQRLSRFNPRQGNLRNPIESAKRVVIPICRYEKLQYDNIKITGGFPELYIDQRAMMQVFYNLFTNAIKYRRRGEREEFSVFVRSTSRENVAIQNIRLSNDLSQGQKISRVSGHFVDVGDYGMGINPEHERKIFSEGFRAPEMGKLEIRGSGIGLSVVQNILSAMGASVWLARPRDPTMFTLFFPSQLGNRRTSDAHYRQHG